MCVDIHMLGLCGKDSSRTGSARLFIENRDYSYRYTVDDLKIKNGWEEADIWLPCGRKLMNNVDLDEPIFLDHV